MTESITANQAFGAAASYFNVWRLNNINDANDSKIIYARPYWVTMDGTKVEGLAKYVHVEDGYKNYISVPINLLTGEAVAAGALDLTYPSEKLEIVGVETGRIFSNMQIDQTSKTGTIKMVGYAKPTLHDGALVHTQADGIYANVRFVEKEDGDADGTHFDMKIKDFCDWDEELVKTVKAWDVTYISVKQTGMDKEDSRAVSFDFIGGDHVMPIAGYYGPCPYYVTGFAEQYEEIPDYITDGVFDLIDKIGINLIVYSKTDYSNNRVDERTQKTTEQLLKESLKYGEKYGIGIFVDDSSIRGKVGSESILASELKNQIANYSKYPAFCGMFLVDEPKTSYYKSDVADKKYIEDYGELANVLQYDLNLNCYMNMFPWSPSAGTQDIYKQYVDEFCETLKPKFLSWDKYPFESSDTLDVYFYNMSLMREKSEQYHVPFWAYIQAGGKWNNPEASTPTEGKFHWNVSTSLAFGAQGIQYFPLIQPSGFANIGTKDSPIWDFDRSGLIGADGNENDWYGFAQSSNQHIAAIDEVLMDAVHKGIIVNAVEEGEKGTGWSDIEEVKSVLDDTTLVGCVLKQGIDKEYYVEKNIIGYQTTKEKPDTELEWRELRDVDGNVLIGCFNYNGKTALYVVNYDMDRTQNNITLNLDKEHAIRVTQKTTTTTQRTQSLTLNMDAGEGVLLVIE